MCLAWHCKPLSSYCVKETLNRYLCFSVWVRIYDQFEVFAHLALKLLQSEAACYIYILTFDEQSAKGHGAACFSHGFVFESLL